jgi:hypothetical protein
MSVLFWRNKFFFALLKGHTPKKKIAHLGPGQRTTEGWNNAGDKQIISSGLDTSLVN